MSLAFFLVVVVFFHAGVRAVVDGAIVAPWEAS